MGAMMIIYEVNLSIDKGIYSKFELWLTAHVKEMLQFPGFIQAFIFKEEQGDVFDQHKLTVQYQLENRVYLETYFSEFAPKMREEGMKLFGDNYSATRRIFETQAVISK
jgi:hypothetical protein